MPKKILFATDYSEASNDAFVFATSLARDWKADLLIVHVSQHEQYPVGELFDEEPEPPAEEVAELTRIAPADSSIPCEHRLLFGPPSSENVKPARAIVNLAKEEGVDAIVLGTHGRSALSHLLIGSVTESVLREAPCPVVTVRHPRA